MAERQTATRVEDVRADHRGRYKWAAQRLADAGLVAPVVLDAGCGCGYGSSILAASDCAVIGVDRHALAIAHACRHFGSPGVQYEVADLAHLPMTSRRYDAIVCFEVIEHVAFAPDLVKQFARLSDRLYCSVPNEKQRPFDPTRFPYHVRHYTADELVNMLAAAGWSVPEVYGQARLDVEKVTAGREGMTIVVEAFKA